MIAVVVVVVVVVAKMLIVECGSEICDNVTAIRCGAGVMNLICKLVAANECCFRMYFCYRCCTHLKEHRLPAAITCSYKSNCKGH